MGQNPTGSWSIPMATVGTWGSSPQLQPTVGATPRFLPKLSVIAGGTLLVGGWSFPSHTSRGSSLGAAEEGSYSLTRSAHRAHCRERLSND